MRKNKEAKKKIQWQQYIAVAFFMLIGAVCGVLMTQYVDKNARPDTSGWENLFSLACLFVGMYVAIFLQLIIHEAGHLVFGFLYPAFSDRSPDHNRIDIYHLNQDAPEEGLLYKITGRV